MTTRTGQNRVTGLADFRAEWDRKRPSARAAATVAEGDHGHINVEGSASCLSGAIFTPADPEFLRSIEEGIRPLVTLLVEDLDCITYSSCEGHPPAGEARMRVSHVGILPRDDADRARIRAALEPAAAAVPLAAAAVLELVDDVIASDDGTDVLCVDVVFRPLTLDWAAYSASAAALQAALVEALRLRPSDAERAP